MNKYTFSTKSGKAYYCNSIPGFIHDNSTSIIGQLVKHSFEVNAQVLGKSDLSNKVLAFGATIIRNSKISLHCEIKDKIIENATYASDTKY